MYDDNDLIPGLATGEFRKVNIELAREIGHIPALLLHDLYNQYLYFKRTNSLIYDKKTDKLWFYYTGTTAWERLAIGDNMQRSVLKIIEKFGLCERKLIGLPAQRHVSLNFNKLRTLMRNIEINLNNQRELTSGAEGYERLRQDQSNSRYWTRENHASEALEAGHDLSLYEESYHKEREIKKEKYSRERARAKKTSKSPKLEKSVKKPKMPPKSPMISFGSHVRLTQSDHAVLVERHGANAVSAAIGEMNDYLASHGKSYKCYAAALRRWISNASAKPMGHQRAPIVKAAPVEPVASERVAMGGKRINPALYKYFESSGKDMTGYISDESLS